ncbi:MAG: hypothetical protein KAY24_14130 [Candidatus Eisenbacteria sp.]|nr:hypothetical protein [Candidatus Eisenbacteria bacterium]
MKVQDALRLWVLFPILLALAGGCSEDTTEPKVSVVHPVANFEAAGGEGEVVLSWTNPSDEAFHGVLIHYALDACPIRPDSGTAVPGGTEGCFEGEPDSTGTFTHTMLENGLTYFYSAFACDHNLNYSTGVCASAEVPLPAPLFLPRTSPENLIANLRVAYDEWDLAEYDSLFAADFIFFLMPDDQHIAEHFDRELEIAIHGNLFDTEFVQTLILMFETVTGEDITLDEARSTPQDSLWTAVMTNVDLLVFGVTPGHPYEHPMGYEMEDGQEQFWFRKNAWTDPGSGEQVWTIVEWREIYTGGTRLGQALSVPPAGPSSWGVIKALYR